MLLVIRLRRDCCDGCCGAVGFPTMESGSVHASTDGWTTVTLDESYDSMVVVAQVVLPAGMPPMVSRIRNAGGNTFEVMVQRVDGSAVDIHNIQIQYMAVEEGVYNLEDHGIKMEAVKYNSTVTDKAGDFTGEHRALAHELYDHYFVPTIFGQVMSYNDSDWSTFWYKGQLDSFQMGKHVGEDSDTTRADETIGYIVMESGTTQIGDYLFQTGDLGTDGYDGFWNFSGSTASHTFDRFSTMTGALFSASIGVPWGASNTGDEGFWVVQEGLSNNTVKVRTVEDQLSDNEQDSGTKGGSYILFSSYSNKPTVMDDTVGVTQGDATVIDVLSNDILLGAGGLSVESFTEPRYGTLVDNGDGTLTYTSPCGILGC